jgi:hypothetical protein
MAVGQRSFFRSGHPRALAGHICSAVAVGIASRFSWQRHIFGADLLVSNWIQLETQPVSH